VNTNFIESNKSGRTAGSSKLSSRHIRDFLFHILEKTIGSQSSESVQWLRCLGDVHLAASSPAFALKCYTEYMAIHTDFFENHNSPHWSDNILLRRMIKCFELLGCYTQVRKNFQCLE